MARSLGLSAYLAFARRQPPSATDLHLLRPEGELIWIHCADLPRANALVQLGLRLAGQRGGVRLLLTTPPGQPRPPAMPPKVYWQECPSEHPADARAFLDHWRPDTCLWLGPWLRPSLIDSAHKRAIPLFLLDADNPGLENKRWRFLPEPVRGTLALFTAILTHSPEAQTQIRRILPESTPVLASGPLLDENPALPCNETDLEDLRGVLQGRPVWLAAHLHLHELRAVLNAHRTVMRLSHRLLLVLVPDASDDAATLMERCRDEGLQVAQWDEGRYPDANTQIVLSADRRELGLWYRLSPVTFMGRSLAPGLGGCNPFEPAALGSAVLYGPSVRNYLDSYSRLAQAGGARIVRDGDSLATALSQLIAPDQAAALAHAGWDVVSEGAEVSDQIIELVQQALDERGAN